MSCLKMQELYNKFYFYGLFSHFMQSNYLTQRREKT